MIRYSLSFRYPYRDRLYMISKISCASRYLAYHFIVRFSLDFAFFPCDRATFSLSIHLNPRRLIWITWNDQYSVSRAIFDIKNLRNNADTLSDFYNIIEEINLFVSSTDETATLGTTSTPTSVIRNTDTRGARHIQRFSSRDPYTERRLIWKHIILTDTSENLNPVSLFHSKYHRTKCISKSRHLVSTDTFTSHRISHDIISKTMYRFHWR